MEQKLVEKKKAVEVTGNGSFDKDGKMLIPYKEPNGEMVLKTQKEMQKILAEHNANTQQMRHSC